MEETDLILLWGSNARETHPVMFLHMLKGINNGARLVVVDPRRTLSVEAAHDWLPIRVGGDIALANAMGHVIIEEGLQHQRFIDHATTGFADYKRLVASYTPEWAQTVTGIPAEKPLQSNADAHKVERLLRGLDFVVVQDILMTATAELADVVLPGAASWAESDGTVTNSERRVQLCRKALEPPGEAHDDNMILQDIANRMGADWH